MTQSPATQERGLDVFIIACESSADELGAGFITAMQELRPGSRFRGTGGVRMAEAGVASLFPIEELATIGVLGIAARLPSILRRLRQTVEAILADPPDVLLLVDAPDFTHRVARRVRRRLPALPTVKYVSPSVWVWRAGRARAMRPNIDLLLALLPFEPEVHRELGGPRCIYVGHPLLGRLADLRPSHDEAARRAAEPPLVLALPGSRHSEVRRLGAVFGETLGRVAEQHGPIEVVLPTVPHLVGEIAAATANWPVRPRIVVGEAEKHAAFRRARAALAASGTVTLELALAGIPTVAAYRIPVFDELILRANLRHHPAIKVQSMILANLVLGELAIPEFLQRRCTADHLAPALAGIVGDTQARKRQLEAFSRLDAVLGTEDMSPSERAARAVLDFLGG